LANEVAFRRHSRADAANEKPSGAKTGDGLGSRAKQRPRHLLTEDRTEMIVEVYFFGGWKASPIDMHDWAATAAAQQPGIDFTAFHWFEKDKVKKAITAIKASKADAIYIVGHSSGCENANDVDRAAVGTGKGLVDPKKVVLVALDGFVPDSKQLGRASTQVWSALGPGDEPSWNYDKLKYLGTRLTIHRSPWCTKVWPLHFSLVNANATDTLVKDPPAHLTTGYAGCNAFLKWL
jgi:hypothetical protein